MTSVLIRDLLPRRWFAVISLLLVLSFGGDPLLRQFSGADGFSTNNPRLPLGHHRRAQRRRQQQLSFGGDGSVAVRSGGCATTSLRALEVLVDPVASLARTLVSSYGTALVDHPLPTKSITAGILCGVSDVIAQKRSGGDGDPYDLRRTIRFASKGCFGGILWMFWYNWIDGFLAYNANVNGDDLALSDASSKLSFYVLTGAVLPPGIGASFRSFASDHTGAVTTGVSMVLEQFLWCPLVYGTFEIPVSTLMNGGRFGNVKGEVDSKLNGLLVSNAKVWTLANLVIYNTPLEWRLFLGNCIDILWQSIVSDVSADCGGDDDELCVLTEDIADERVAAEQ